jgi:SAM-dependent methyltransferase
MEPFGRAIRAYVEGDSRAELVLLRDDGLEGAIPVSQFFRDEPDFNEMEKRALELSRGRVLDIGAGSGSLSVALERRGLAVTAMDINEDSAAIVRARGIANVRLADLSDFEGGPFDTLLMIGHAIGMVETIAGLKRFLSRAHSLVAPGGQILLDSLDVRATDDPRHLAYHEANRKAGRYIGEIRMRIGFEGREGPSYGWLQVDAETLAEHAGEAGWRCEILYREGNGNYLARLSPRNETNSNGG